MQTLFYLVFNFNLQNLTSFTSPTSLTNQSGKSEGTPSAEDTAKVKEEMEALTQQQHLINQYMHLNIQLLSQKLENLGKAPADDRLRAAAAPDGTDDAKALHKKRYGWLTQQTDQQMRPRR
jgi:hypothetical protein